MKPCLILFLVAALTALLYLPGLPGEFIFDDTHNFQNLERWSANQIGWHTVVLNHQAGPLGRPLTMATFLANTAVSGVDPFAFKATNLILHLGIGLLVFAVARRLSGRDPRLAQQAELVALGTATVWLLHPIMVGTVLYAVQRMAMLAALFMLLAILTYLRGRELLEGGEPRRGAIWIFVGVPLFTVLGALSKENALLAPLICAVIELTLFKPASGKQRQKAARVFLVVGAALPVAIALGIMIVNPAFYFDGFANRPFTPIERLMTQSRVLFDYVGQLLLPRGQAMSLFRDDYVVSAGPLSPWTTLASLVGWGVIVSIALAARNRLPLFTAGIGIFLVGHAMESSIFPLLIYFEHRNYFPSLGLFLAIAAAIAWGWQYLSTRIARPKFWPAISLAALGAVLAVATFARAATWASNEVLLNQQLQHHPNSRSIRMELAQIEMNRNPPAVAAAQTHYRHLSNLDRPSTRLIGTLGLAASNCYSGRDVDSIAIEHAFSETPDAIEADVIEAIESVAHIVRAQGCEGLTAQQYARTLVDFAESLQQSHQLSRIWRIRFHAARLFRSANHPEMAIEQAKAAWADNPDELPIGLLVAQLHAELGNLRFAQEILKKVGPQISETDRIGQRALTELQQTIEAGSPRKN
jgi:hypothetical protein